MLEIEDLISACGNDDDDDVLLDYFERERERETRSRGENENHNLCGRTIPTKIRNKK